MSATQTLASIFEGNEIAAKRAMETTKFVLEGKKSIGNEWGLGVRVELETTRGCILRPSGTAAWSVTGPKVIGHSKRAAIAILAPFRINWEEFETAFPRPTGSWRETITLENILKRLRPNLA
jgi:hypothetical protein